MMLALVAASGLLLGTWGTAAVAEGDGDEPVERLAGVEVFFSNLELGGEGEVFGVERRVPMPRVLRGAMTELLAGPDQQELAAGYTSWFSSETAGMLDTVELADGVARIGFDARLPEAIPGASSAAGSRALLAALDATATQFPTVDDAIYSLEGDTDAFYHWLQRGSPA